MDRAQARTETTGAAAIFDRVADTYDQVGVPWFQPIADRLLAELRPEPGERALDIGSGRGAVLLPLAEAVGPSGRVSGIDLAPRMVELLQADVDERGLDQVHLHVMDATDPSRLPDGWFDLITSSLVVFFLPDPAAALKNWRRLLRPGGRIGISTFGPHDPLWSAINAVFTPYLPKQLLDARASGTAGPFGSDEGVAGLFEAAGYGAVRTVGFDIIAELADADEWHRWSWSHGQRASWESVPEDKREAVRAAAAEVLESARGNDGRIRLNQQFRLTIADRD